MEEIVNLFENNWEMLEKLYLLAIGEDFDYEGKLLIKLVRKDFSFWDKFTNKLAGNIHRTMYEHNVFESIWEMDNYKELIQIACDNMLDGYFGFMVEDEGTAIFANSQNTSEFIKQRKILWIREYMRQNIENKNNIKMIFNIIAVFFPEDRKMFLLELMNYKRDVELFKSIPLFSSFSSWGGSEVPLIDKKIDFLSDLIDAFKGIDFIEHRAYLKEEKNSYECYKQEVLIREYLMNEDIA